MPSVGQQNLETVVVGFFGALRRGDFEGAATVLAHDVAWQGLREDLVCHGRDEVIETFRSGLVEHRELDALEFVRGGDRVVFGARGAGLREIGGWAGRRTRNGAVPPAHTGRRRGALRP